MIRGLVEERTDPVLFRMSYHYVGDLAETVALIWPAPGEPPRQALRARPQQSAARAEPHRGGRDPRDRQQERPAGSHRRLARRPRRDRALGAAEAHHPRIARRRLGAARQDGGRAARRVRAGRGRADLARAGAALRGVVRLGRRPRSEARSRTTPRRSARRCCRIRWRRRISRSSTPPISSPNGNGTASASRRSPAARATGDRCGASIPAPARMSRGAFPDLVEALDFEGAHRRRIADRRATAASRASTSFSSA